MRRVANIRERWTGLLCSRMKWSMPTTEWNSTTRKIDEIFLIFRCNGNVGRENSTCTDKSGRRTNTDKNHAFPNCVFHERTFRNFSPFQRNGPYLDSMANEALIFFCMREVFFFYTASKREAGNIDKSAWRKKDFLWILWCDAFEGSCFCWHFEQKI